jgi:hypothetical protein
MRATARLQRHHAPRLACEKLKHLATRYLPAEQLPTTSIRAMRVERLLCDIQTNRANFFHGRLLSGAQQHLLGISIPSGGVHPI